LLNGGRGTTVVVSTTPPPASIKPKRSIKQGQ
jgi:hypothetical protein